MCLVQHLTLGRKSAISLKVVLNTSWVLLSKNIGSKPRHDFKYFSWFKPPHRAVLRTMNVTWQVANRRENLKDNCSSDYSLKLAIWDVTRQKKDLQNLQSCSPKCNWLSIYFSVFSNAQWENMYCELRLKKG